MGISARAVVEPRTEGVVMPPNLQTISFFDGAKRNAGMSWESTTSAAGGRHVSGGLARGKGLTHLELRELEATVKRHRPSVSARSPSQNEQ